MNSLPDALLSNILVSFTRPHTKTPGMRLTPPAPDNITPLEQAPVSIVTAGKSLDILA